MFVFLQSSGPKVSTSAFLKERNGDGNSRHQVRICESLVGFLWFTIKSINTDHKVNMKEKGKRKKKKQHKKSSGERNEKRKNNKNLGFQMSLVHVPPISITQDARLQLVKVRSFKWMKMKGGAGRGGEEKNGERETAARRESNTKKQGNWRQRNTSGCLISDLGRKREEFFFLFLFFDGHR